MGTADDQSLIYRSKKMTPRYLGLATVQFAVVEVEPMVTSFENGLGCTLDVQRVGKPRG